MSAWDQARPRSTAARIATLVAVVATIATGWAGGPPTTQASTLHDSARARSPAADRGPRVADRPIVVASKPFAESYILAEMFAQLLEAHGRHVERRLGLGGTDIAYAALRRGAIDVYPEYTGTGLVVVLGLPPAHDPTTVFGTVVRESERRDSVRWLPPLGFENTYAIAVRHGLADSLHLATLSDLARVASTLRAGLTADFIGRADGLPGLTAAYGIRFRGVRTLLPAIKYQALAAGAVDVIDGYSTDGLIARYDLVALRDDRHFYPPYQAAAVVGRDLQRVDPAAVLLLTELSGRIDETRMRQLNERVEVDGVDAPTVAHDALRVLGLTTPAAAPTEARPPTSEFRPPRSSRLPLGGYLRAERRAIAASVGRHLILVGLSLAAALVVALPLGVLLTAVPRRAEGVIRTVGILETIPSIALLAFMIPLLGIGVVPALAALLLYSLYPIVRNTYTGVRDADHATVNAARALGMTPRQVLAYVRLPLAVPVIMAGIRTAAVLDVGTATLAAFIGAGGLGDQIIAGLALSDTRMILSGAVPAALLALAVDALLGGGERWAARRWGRGR